MLSLRALDVSDAAWLDEWLAPVAASVGYDELDADRPGATLLDRSASDPRVHARIIVRDSDDDVGLAVYRIDAPRRGAAVIEIVATRREFARRGSGMGAVALIEDELRAAGVGEVYAPAPAMHGIAVYFWIRLGYRPLMRAAWPCERAGVAWLVRAL